MPYAEVAVNAWFNHRDTYTYGVPPGMDVRPGHAVYVPFGRRRLQGVVLALAAAPRFDAERVLPIGGVIAPEPLLSPERVELARWLSAYYLAPPFPGAQLMLPPGFEQRPLTHYRALLLEGARRQPTERELQVWNYLRENGPVEAAPAAVALGLSVQRPLDALVRKGLAVRTFELAPARGRHRTVPYVRLAAGREIVEGWLARPRGTKPSRAADLLERLADAGRVSLESGAAVEAAARTLEALGLARRDGDALALIASLAEARERADGLRHVAAVRTQVETLRLLLTEGPLHQRSVMRERTGIDLPSLRALEEEGLIVLEEVQVERDPLSGRDYPPRPAPMLTRGQADVLRPVVAALRERKPRTFLLHGVTGSGKTEVYLSALEQAVALGGRGIALVPEIALTPQAVRRFAERFPGRVAVLHSGLTLGQRFDQWSRIQRGEYDVVVGARGALFAPQPNLSLIILDEEHEWTYKQSDALPRYHARETAERLSELTGAALVLGSATPDVMSYQRAEEGRYTLLDLPDRIAAFEDGDGPAGVRPLPAVEVVDMREELRAGNRDVFSRSLHEAIVQALAQEEQVILFLNRRGSASFLLCRDCGHSPACSSCGPAYAYHEDVGNLVCHQCGRRQNVPERCPRCDGRRLRPVGIGTQRLEEETARVFPEARTMRWDRDVTRERGAHEQLLERFLERQADILIGTQMVAKGLDLPYVTVVGVIAADIGLHVPDFRSGERTFQVLSQVVGRAGRGPLGGRAIIQSYAPDHYAIAAASRHDYEGLYREEIVGRKALGYPPFGRLARLIYAGSGERRSLGEAEVVAHRLTEEIRRTGEPGAWVRGPAPAYVPRARGRWRWNVLLRAQEPGVFLARFLDDAPLAEGWEIDIDPVALA